MKKKKKATPMPTRQEKMWLDLGSLIENYAEASRADEVKGGGDPACFEVVELDCQLARAKLNAHIDMMQREFE